MLRLLALVLAVSLPAAAQFPPRPEAPRKAPKARGIEVHAERFTETAAMKARLVTTRGTGQALLTPDGAQLVYLDPEGLQVASLAGGAPRRLTGPTPYFALSRDGRFALVPGAAVQRVSVTGRDGPVELAPKEQLRQGGALTTSERHVAFVSQDGAVVMASLEEGTSARLPIAPPADQRCHAGAAVPKAFSADGQWLLYQHGCAFEVMRVTGGSRKALGFTEARLAGDVVVGNPTPEKGQATVDEVRIVPLGLGLEGRIKGATLQAMAKEVPRRQAFVQADAQGRLQLLDVKAREARVLYEGPRRVNPFLEVSPDGAAVLFSAGDAEGCEVFRLELATGKRQRLAQLDGASQCFVKPLGDARAVLYGWGDALGGTDAVLLEVELTSGLVRRIEVPRVVGNLHAAKGGIALVTREQVFVVAP